MLSQIDRVMVNEEWQLQVPNSFVHFLPEGWLDHSPALISLDQQEPKKPHQFQFYDMWGSHPKFGEIVNHIWSSEVVGAKMYRIVQKLKLLNLHRADYAEVSVRYCKLKDDLEEHQNYSNDELRVKERDILADFS